MNDRQIESFLKVSEDKSFSKASKELFISVPALIEQIDRLEESLGFKLLKRTNQGVSLTKEGEIFKESIVKMKDIYDKTIDSIKKSNINNINIGVPSNECPSFLSEACSIYLKNSKNNISLIDISYSEHLKALEEGIIDLSIIAKPKRAYLKGLKYIKLFEDTYSFGINKNDELVNNKTITLKDLKDKTIMCGSYEYMEKSFKDNLSKSKARLEVIDSDYNLNSRIKAKTNNSIIVFHSKWEDCYKGLFKVIPSNIDGGEIGIVIRKDDYNKLLEFINILKKII